MSNNQPTSDKTLNPSPAGKSYNRKAIKKQIGQALANVDGLLAVDGGFFSNLAGKIVNTDKFTSGVKLALGKEEARVDLNVIAEYKKNVSDLYHDIKRLVIDVIRNMTGLSVIDVNLKVLEVKTQAKQEADSVSLQDHVTHMAESTGEFASDTLGKAKDGIGSGLAAVTEKVGQGVEAAKDAISSGADQAQEVAEEGAQVVEEVADEAKDAVAEVADDAKDAVSEGAQAVQEKSEDLAESSQEAAEDLAEAGQDAAEDLAEASQEAVEATAQAGQEATEDAKELAQEAKDAAQEDAQAVKEAVSSRSEAANSNQA
ncbi:Asp23/Gls24 family envelope stress response protein [uncultured Abiotrophia sp.]|uniref:Asp23/Gls24 family envelope stress response protein n=1 Tax=uncultured Abiotrophia sp. TaxID=316094 RepID=UPI0028D7B081|nr:Asp23/Gls24 family envelope stress response protein [uncultured Abiotrophia sp.]